MTFQSNREIMPRMLIISLAAHLILMLIVFMQWQRQLVLVPHSVTLTFANDNSVKVENYLVQKSEARKQERREAVKEFVESLPFTKQEETPRPVQKTYEEIKKEKLEELERALREVEESPAVKTTPVNKQMEKSLLNEKDIEGARSVLQENGSKTGDTGTADTQPTATQMGVDMDIEQENSARTIVYKPPKPEYPEWAIRDNIQGSVRIRIYIDKDGFVTGADIVKSSGNNFLDVLAKNNLLKYRFSAISEDREEYALIRMNFTLDSR